MACLVQESVYYFGLMNLSFAPSVPHFITFNFPLLFLCAFHLLFLALCLTCEQPLALEVVAHAHQRVVGGVDLAVADGLDALMVAHVPQLQAA